MKPVTCSRCDRCWSSRGLNGHWCGNINGPYIEKYPLPTPDCPRLPQNNHKLLEAFE